MNDLAQLYIGRIIPSARATGDAYSISRSWWYPLVTHRIMPTAVDLCAGLAECFALAERLQNPTLLARAHTAAGVMIGARDPGTAAHHFNEGERYARLVNTRFLIGGSIAFGAVATSMINARAGLLELLRALDWHRATGSPAGVTSSLLRDVIPALSEVGLHRVALLLDAHLPPFTLLGRLDDIAASIERCVQALDPGDVAQLRGQAKDLDIVELLAVLRSELEPTLQDLSG